MDTLITWLQGKKTNILSWAALILGALVLAGALTPEQQGEANQRLAATVERLTALLIEVAGLISLAMRAAIKKVEPDNQPDILPYRQRP